MFSCRETTRLASDALDRKLTWLERMRLLMHFIMCGPCKLARRRMLFLREAASRLRQSEAGDGLGLPGLSPAARLRIQQALGGDSAPHSR